MDTSIKPVVTPHSHTPRPAGLERIPEARSAGSQGRNPLTLSSVGRNSSFGKIISDVTDLHQIRRSVPGAVSYLEHKNHMMNIARSDPAEAAALAYGYAHNSLSGELLDCSDRPNIRYSATGELVTPATSAYFARTYLAMQKERTELYQAELSKGTHSADILEKIFDFNESMPTRFLEMAGW